MEEELNENDLEERLYAMIHHVDGTQAYENTEPSQDAFPRFEEAPRSTVRRYWRTGNNSSYQKINTPKDAPANKNTLANVNKTPVVNKSTPATVNRSTPATVNRSTPATVNRSTPATVNRSTPATLNRSTPATLNRSTPATLNRSTPATVNRSTPATLNRSTPATVNRSTPATLNRNTPATVNRSHAAATTTTDAKPKEEKDDAPVSPPSALAILQNTAPQNFVKTVEILEFEEEPKVFELQSSDEDEVIEVALPPKPTITIESSDDDELIVETVNKSKDKANNKASKENKSPNKSNRDISASPVPSVVSSMSDDFIRGDCIALNISSAQPDNQSFDFSLHGSDLLGDGTPSKKKRKKKTKDRVTSTPIAAEAAQKPQNIDNIFATPKSKAKNKKTKTKSYAVSEKIIPNADVYDSDSNQSAIDITKNHDAYIVTEKSFPSADVYESDSSVTESIRDTRKQPPQKKTPENDCSDSNASMELPVNNTSKNADKTLVVDLTDDYTTVDKTGIEENIVIGNVSGISNVQEYGDNSLIDTATSAPKELGIFCSTKVPQILYEDLDFDHLKGKDKVCKRRRYSLTTLRAEMEKFYNESWGGENFNHQEIQKNMSRDKSLWVIDPKDRMPNPPKRRVTCNYCNRVGHRDDTCRLKPPVCHMCGNTGHYEPRCPKKICVNCGSPNFMYSTKCRNCAPWRQLTCAECGQPGHPASHCPDIWRRYHNTVDENMPLEACSEKPQYQLQCSGCARRGHLAHACRAFVPLCALPVPAPRVARYWRVYPPTREQEHPDTPNTHRKRLSKSPMHETHVNKKRMSESEPQPKQKKNSQSEEAEPRTEIVETSEKTPDFIPIGPNHDEKGQVIQDNEVSDTSEVRTSARIYLSEDMMNALQTRQGREWMADSMKAYNVDVHMDDTGSFLTVVGTVGDQETFQSGLRAWRPAGERSEPQNEENATVTHLMPRKKNDVLRKLNSAFESLKGDIGDPRAIYKELTFLQNRHDSIKSMKVISPKQLNNNRTNINDKLKKLNMLLLGQAGLAGGAEHLTALLGLQKKVTNIRNQKVPYLLRAEISQHYQTIFTGLPRDDYKDLMKMFYSKQINPVITDKMTKSQAISMKRKMNNKNAKAPPQINPLIKSANKQKPTNVNFEQQAQGKPKGRGAKKLLEQLTRFHSDLLRRRVNFGCNNIRNNMANQVHTQIMSLNGCDGQTKQELQMHVKTALGVQRQARQLLQTGKWKGKRVFLENQKEN